MKQATRFELNGKVYEMNDKGNRFFVSDEANGICRKRIGQASYEKALEEYKKLNPEEPKEEKKAKGEKKARRSKDIAHESNGVTLTAKQVDFLHHLKDTSFWENGLDSTPWCDCLADEIGGQFAGKPMTVGAMISTLREKGLLEVGREEARQGKPKFMAFTSLGKKVAAEVAPELA